MVLYETTVVVNKIMQKNRILFRMFYTDIPKQTFESIRISVLFNTTKIWKKSTILNEVKQFIVRDNYTRKLIRIKPTSAIRVLALENAGKYCRKIDTRNSGNKKICYGTFR